MSRCKWLGSISLGVAAWLISSLIAGAAVADWQVYVAPGLGISGAIVDTDGKVDEGNLLLDSILSGDDSDSSPLLDLAVGLEVPIDELVPREWLFDVRLPNWPVRLEMEGAGLREYELRTDTSSDDAFFTEIKAETLMFNGWLDIPMTAIYQPIQYTLGLGRQPTVRRWLELASFYLGAGIGVGFLDIKGTSNVLSASDNPIDFAWNVGAGINYALTENVSLSAGYRYVGLGKQSIELKSPSSPNDDEIDFDPQVHELRIAIRIRVFEFLSPWR